MQCARPRATFRSRRSTCAGRRARSSSVKVRAQLSQLGVGAIERAFLSVFGHMKGHVCQRGRRNRQTQVMVYRMGISMEPVCLHGRIGMFLSEDGYILSRVRRGPTSLCPHGPGEPSGALGRPRGGPPWPSGGWTDPRARGRISRHGKGVKGIRYTLYRTDCRAAWLMSEVRSASPGKSGVQAVSAVKCLPCSWMRSERKQI